MILLYYIMEKSYKKHLKRSGDEVKLKLKRGDKIIIMGLLLISLLPYIFFSLLGFGKKQVCYAKITIAGKLYQQIPLTGHQEKTFYTIETPHGTNKLIVEKEQIAVIEADCRDGICMQRGFIGKVGESITCLPHELHIEIVGKGTSRSKTDVNTY